MFVVKNQETVGKLVVSSHLTLTKQMFYAWQPHMTDIFTRAGMFIACRRACVNWTQLDAGV